TSYYHADAATPINVHYAVECTTCHNPHLASGRWDDATSGTGSPTPIVLPGVTQSLYLSNSSTYPYQWPPSSWGLSYQRGDLWGDDPVLQNRRRRLASYLLQGHNRHQPAERGVLRKRPFTQLENYLP
ncbi:MAG: hypothetical protein HY886_05665, partial [Deltaproteobacteria bacterium]|nr:hypothetical protein [Deltaproteobacteria bacterium]